MQEYRNGHYMELMLLVNTPNGGVHGPIQHLQPRAVESNIRTFERQSKHKDLNAVRVPHAFPTKQSALETTKTCLCIELRWTHICSNNNAHSFVVFSSSIILVVLCAFYVQQGLI